MDRKDSSECNSKNPSMVKTKISVQGDGKWKHYIPYVFVFLIAYNYAIAPVVMAVFGVWLPPIVLNNVIKILVLILSGT